MLEKKIQNLLLQMDDIFLLQYGSDFGKTFKMFLICFYSALESLNICLIFFLDLNDNWEA